MVKWTSNRHYCLVGFTISHAVSLELQLEDVGYEWLRCVSYSDVGKIPTRDDRLRVVWDLAAGVTTNGGIG